jgi:transcriptional regulator with XRE-family HTH domain
MPVAALPDDTPFPALLRAWRLKRLLSQSELAALANLSPDTIAGLERGRTRPSMRSLRRLSQALQVEPESLTSGPPHPAA